MFFSPGTTFTAAACVLLSSGGLLLWRPPAPTETPLPEPPGVVPSLEDLQATTEAEVEHRTIDEEAQQGEEVAQKAAEVAAEDLQTVAEAKVEHRTADEEAQEGDEVARKAALEAAEEEDEGPSPTLSIALPTAVLLAFAAHVLDVLFLVVLRRCCRRARSKPRDDSATASVADSAAPADADAAERDADAAEAPLAAEESEQPVEQTELVAVRTELEALRVAFAEQERRAAEAQQRLAEEECSRAREAAAHAEQLTAARAMAAAPPPSSPCPPSPARTPCSPMTESGAVARRRSLGADGLAEVMRRKRESCHEFKSPDPEGYGEDKQADQSEATALQMLSSLSPEEVIARVASPSRPTAALVAASKTDKETAGEIRELTEKLKEAVATIAELQAKAAAELPTTPTASTRAQCFAAAADSDGAVALGRKRLSDCGLRTSARHMRNRRASAPAATSTAACAGGGAEDAGQEGSSEGSRAERRMAGTSQALWTAAAMPKEMTLLRLSTCQPPSVLEPENMLYFCKMPGTQMAHAFLYLVNSHSACVAFKIKTTMTKSCKVKPSMAILQPGEEVEAQIYLPSSLILSKKQRFLVQAMVMQSADAVISDCWDSNACEEQRLNVVLHACEEDPQAPLLSADSDPQTASLDSDVFNVRVTVPVKAPLHWVWQHWPREFDMSKIMTDDPTGVSATQGVVSQRASADFGEEGSHIYYKTIRGTTDVDEVVKVRDHATKIYQYESDGGAWMFKGHMAFTAASQKTTEIVWTYALTPKNDSGRAPAHEFLIGVWAPFIKEHCAKNLAGAIEKVYAAVREESTESTPASASGDEVPGTQQIATRTDVQALASGDQVAGCRAENAEEDGRGAEDNEMECSVDSGLPEDVLADDIETLLQARWIVQDPHSFAIFEDENEEQQYHKRRSLALPQLLAEITMLREKNTDLYGMATEFLEDYEKKTEEVEVVINIARRVGVHFCMKAGESDKEKAEQTVGHYLKHPRDLDTSL